MKIDCAWYNCLLTKKIYCEILSYFHQFNHHHLDDRQRPVIYFFSFFYKYFWFLKFLERSYVS